MASAPADLTALASAEQIFSSHQHTLPQIRQLHKALHAQMDDKAARLRTQVGGSYRELLGTADAIVRMRADMERVQRVLGRMGGRCGRAVVGAKVAGLAGFVGGGGEDDEDDEDEDREEEVEEEEEEEMQVHVGPRRDLGVAARARLLAACTLAAGRMLRGGGAGEEGAAATRDTAAGWGDRLVVAAKVLLLGRLLGKSFGEMAAEAVEVRAAVEAGRKTIGSLRRRLLRGVKKVLQRGEETGGQGDVLKALCAYSLATSSGAKDVLWHFLHLRAEAMALAFDVGGGERFGGADHVLKCLVLYTRTLLDVQALVPYKLADALAALKKNALLADGTLRDLEGLRLDVYDRWCGEDIQYFKPYLRHDDLDGRQAKEMLVGWAKKGADVLIQGLVRTLEHMTEFKSVTELRTRVLQLWIRDGGKAKGFDPDIMLDKIREAINGHLLAVLDTKVRKLRLVGTEVSATVEAWREGVTDKHDGLWAEDVFDMDLSYGASQFTQDVISRLYGRNQAVAKAVFSYKSWRQVMDDVGDVVDQLRKQRWDNDVDEIEDEDTIEHRQQLLSKDDPQMLHDRLNASLETTFEALEEHLAKVWEAKLESPNSGHIAMYLLRIIRDIRSSLPKLAAIEGLGLEIVPGLHAKLAVAVVVYPLDDFATGALARQTVVGRSLWEGKPALPTMPSPGAFRFLRNVSASMGDVGVDLWSATAVKVLKTHLSTQLCDLWLEALANHLAEAEAEADNGDEVADETNSTGGEAETSGKGEGSKEGTASAPNRRASAEQRKDLLVQWLFDISLLRCCLGPPAGTSRDVFKKLEEMVYERSELGNDEARQRITKATQDYWKKSSLLFGLLA